VIILPTVVMPEMEMTVETAVQLAMVETEEMEMKEVMQETVETVETAVMLEREMKKKRRKGTDTKTMAKEVKDGMAETEVMVATVETEIWVAKEVKVATEKKVATVVMEEAMAESTPETLTHALLL
jgi:hypothetical protein